MLRVFHHVYLHSTLEALYEHLHQEHVHLMCRSGRCCGGLSLYNFILIRFCPICYLFVYGIKILLFFLFLSIFKTIQFYKVSFSFSNLKIFNILSFSLTKIFNYLDEKERLTMALDMSKVSRLLLQRLHIPGLLLQPLLQMPQLVLLLLQQQGRARQVIYMKGSLHICTLKN